jgi:hypothetical protein
VTRSGTGTKRAGNSDRKAVNHHQSLTGEVPQLHERIAVRAFAIFEKRGKQDGRDWEDWFRAEHEVLGERMDADLSRQTH